MDLFLRSDARDEAWHLIEEFHYSHTRPRASILDLTWHEPGGLFGDRGRVVAACVFGMPATSRWREMPIELSRLVRRPGYLMPLTPLISAGCLELRRRGVLLVVAYADPAHGHHGGIYQAASWRYGGLRGGAVGTLRIDGVVIHPRTANRVYGSCGVRKLRERFNSVEAVPAVPKHLYWRALNRHGKAKAGRLGLESLPYPKPGAVK